jgi:hypothetical protein
LGNAPKTLSTGSEILITEPKILGKEVKKLIIASKMPGKQKPFHLKRLLFSIYVCYRYFLSALKALIKPLVEVS